MEESLKISKMYDAKACIMRRDYEESDGLDLFCRGQFLKETWNDGYRVSNIKSDFSCNGNGDVVTIVVSGDV
jgi:hypothetical protein